MKEGWMDERVWTEFLFSKNGINLKMKNDRPMRAYHKKTKNMGKMGKIIIKRKRDKQGSDSF